MAELATYVSLLSTLIASWVGSSSPNPKAGAQHVVSKTSTEIMACRPWQARCDVAAKALELLEGAPSNVSWAWHWHLLSKSKLDTGRQPWCRKATESSSTGDLDRKEGRGKDFDENGGGLQRQLTTILHPTHISLTCSGYAGIAAEMKW